MSFRTASVPLAHKSERAGRSRSGREADTPYVYKPHADAGESYRWDAAAKAGLKDYNLLDLSI